MGSYIISIAKTASKKIGALICSMKFLSPKIALYLYKSTIWACMEYCCHAWAGAPRCYLELLDKPQKQICRIVGHCWSFTCCLSWTLGSLSKYSQLKPFLFHLNWLNWFHFLILEGGLMIILIDFIIFLSPFLDVTRTSMSIVSFLVQLLLTHDLNGF